MLLLGTRQLLQQLTAVSSIDFLGERLLPDRITPALRELKWLSIENVSFLKAH